jgi:hypothetical protein
MHKDYMLRYRYDGGAWQPFQVYPCMPTNRQVNSCRKYVQARKPYKRVETDVRIRRRMHV